MIVPLHEIAHGRAGDKGDRCNISVIGYAAATWPVLTAQVTAQILAELFAHRGVSRVVRYELPQLWAMNFVLDDVLGGGVNGSLNLDGHGKTLAFLALSLPVDVPDDIREAARRGRAGG